MDEKHLTKTSFIKSREQERLKEEKWYAFNCFRKIHAFSNPDIKTEREFFAEPYGYDLLNFFPSDRFLEGPIDTLYCGERTLSHKRSI